MLIFGLTVVPAWAKDNEAKGEQTIIVEGFDWGAGVTKTIIQLDKKVDGVSKEKFIVTEKRDSAEDLNVPVKDAYTCDEAGNKISEASTYIALELSVDPGYMSFTGGKSRPAMGNPFLSNVWDESYQLAIQLAENCQLGDISELKIEPHYAHKIAPRADLFGKNDYVDEKTGLTMNYLSYDPHQDATINNQVEDGKRPLIIWLHGGGEGGTELDAVSLGNHVTNLIGPDIQKIMGGAYVFAPQCSTYWLDDGTGEHPFTVDGTSRYSETLDRLLEKYLTEHENEIDINRIYIGGCSNGGYMTIRMVLDHPGKFAAQFPICAPYYFNWLTDEDKEILAKTPTWLIHAKNDPVVLPDGSVSDMVFPGDDNPGRNNPDRETYMLADYLQTNTQSSFHFTNPDAIVDQNGYLDTEGNPLTYIAHFAWVPALRNEVSENNETLFAWMAAQKLVSETDNSSTYTAIAVIGAALVIAGGFVRVKKKKKA